MNITDATYYNSGIRFIPNNNNLNTEIEGVPNSGSEIDYFIAKYERLLLINCLGVEVYEGLKTALEDLDNADEKYKNLVNGVTYTKGGKSYVFDGLRGFGLDSFIANYVFCKYLENDNSYYSTTGTVKSDSANSKNFEPTQKYIDNWLEFLSKYQNSNDVNSPEYYVSNGVIVGVDYFGASDSVMVTLEQFLKDHSKDYNVGTFKRYDSINSFGI